jgi:hypothetical protein
MIKKLFYKAKDFIRKSKVQFGVIFQKAILILF